MGRPRSPRPRWGACSEATRPKSPCWRQRIGLAFGGGAWLIDSLAIVRAHVGVAGLIVEDPILARFGLRPASTQAPRTRAWSLSRSRSPLSVRVDGECNRDGEVSGGLSRARTSGEGLASEAERAEAPSGLWLDVGCPCERWRFLVERRGAGRNAREAL